MKGSPWIHPGFFGGCFLKLSTVVNHPLANICWIFNPSINLSQILSLIHLPKLTPPEPKVMKISSSDEFPKFLFWWLEFVGDGSCNNEATFHRNEFPMFVFHRFPSSQSAGLWIETAGFLLVQNRYPEIYIRWFFRWYPEIPLSAQNRWFPWICFLGDFFNGESNMGWKSPSNHQLREYFCNFLQASNKQVQVMFYPEACRTVPASPCWWINVSMLLEYLLRMVPWKYLMQLGKDQI